MMSQMHEPQNIRTEVISIISKLFEIAHVEPVMNKNFDELDIDSLSFLELITDVEAYFEIEINDAEVDNIKNGNDLVSAIDRTLHGNLAIGSM